MKIPSWAYWTAGGIIAVILYSQRSTLQSGVDDVNALVYGWQNVGEGPSWVPVLAIAEDTYGIPSGLLSRIAYQESRFRPDIINGTKPSAAGALGLMQLMPQYWDTVRRPVPFSTADTSDQITQAAGFLTSLYHHYGNWTNAVAAYNAGQGTIDKVLAGSHALPSQTSDYLHSVFTDLPQYGSAAGLLA